MFARNTRKVVVMLLLLGLGAQVMAAAQLGCCSVDNDGGAIMLEPAPADSMDVDHAMHHNMSGTEADLNVELNALSAECCADGLCLAGACSVYLSTQYMATVLLTAGPNFLVEAPAYYQFTDHYLYRPPIST